ncbi:MAG: LD-carboxypeptidase, partial [Planctomycetota bacterium]
AERYFFRAIEANHDGAAYAVEIPAEAPQPVALGTGIARGRLVGGNLSLISALEGTPYAIDAADAILMIEDTREAPYRVDRMLRQLHLAGKLAEIKGAVLGQFTRNYDREEDQMTDDVRFHLEGVLRQYFATAGIPVLLNFPIGHHPMNVTLPLGGWVEVDADNCRLRVVTEQ